MGVIAALAGLRVHVLVVGVPGHPLLRMRVEAHVRSRGWVLVDAPGDADLLVVAGEPAGATAGAVDALWLRVAAPRARRTIRTAEGIVPALDSARRVLADDALQRTAAPGAGRPERAIRTVGASHLRHRAFGPVAPHWPAGLVLECTTAMGVVVEATARRDPGEAEVDPLAHDARHLVLAGARAAAVLRLAGLPTPAGRLDAVGGRVLAGGDPRRERRVLRAQAGALHRSARARLAFRAAGAPELQSATVALIADAERWAAGAGVASRGLQPAALADRLVGRHAGVVSLLVAAEPWDA